MIVRPSAALADWTQNATVSEYRQEFYMCYTLLLAGISMYAVIIIAKVGAVHPKEVRLHYLVGFEEKANSLPMLDDGVFPDSQVTHSYYSLLLLLLL
jgi:hypothetical protein